MKTFLQSVLFVTFFLANYSFCMDLLTMQSAEKEQVDRIVDTIYQEEFKKRENNTQRWANNSLARYEDRRDRGRERLSGKAFFEEFQREARSGIARNVYNG